jgi:hypothetical protein
VTSFQFELSLPTRKDKDGLEAEYNPDALVFMDFGACKDRDPNIWNTETNHGKTSLRGTVMLGGREVAKADQIEMARILCGLCPVLVECAAHIRRYPEGEGVWAGTIPEEREER